MCQEGVNRVSWHAHGVTYCGQTPGSCPPPPTLIPVSKYTVGQWSAPAPPRMKCDLPEGGVPKFTVGMLARKETESLVNTLKTYEQEGFLQVGSHLKAEGTMCAMRSMLGLPFFPRGYHIRWLLWGLGCELNVCVWGGGCCWGGLVSASRGPRTTPMYTVLSLEPVYNWLMSLCFVCATPCLC